MVLSKFAIVVNNVLNNDSRVMALLIDLTKAWAHRFCSKRGSYPIPEFFLPAGCTVYTKQNISNVFRKIYLFILISKLV